MSLQWRAQRGGLRRVWADVNGASAGGGCQKAQPAACADHLRDSLGYPAVLLVAEPELAVCVVPPGEHEALGGDGGRVGATGKYLDQGAVGVLGLQGEGGEQS